MAWNVTAHRTRRVCCYYLLILKSWRNFPVIKTKGYAKTISASIKAKIRYSLIDRLQINYTENIYTCNDMKQLAVILFFVSIVGCIPKATDNMHVDTNGSKQVPLKAVYLIRGESELSAEDLQFHPEMVVVQTFDELKKYAQQKIALCIDKSATPFNSEQEKWINQAPQTYYPIVLVGTSDTLHAFRDLLRLCCFLGGPGGYPSANAPGFSVIQWEETNEPDYHAVTFLQGFNQKPTVQAILEITNALLEGRLKPTTTVPFIPPATATIVP